MVIAGPTTDRSPNKVQVLGWFTELEESAGLWVCRAKNRFAFTKVRLATTTLCKCKRCLFRTQYRSGGEGLR